MAFDPPSQFWKIMLEIFYKGLYIYYVVRDRGKGCSRFITILRRGGGGWGEGLLTVLQRKWNVIIHFHFHFIFNKILQTPLNKVIFNLIIHQSRLHYFFTVESLTTWLPYPLHINSVDLRSWQTAGTPYCLRSLVIIFFDDLAHKNF